jgi:hypothetical protein
MLSEHKIDSAPHQRIHRGARRSGQDFHFAPFFR